MEVVCFRHDPGYTVIATEAWLTNLGLMMMRLILWASLTVMGITIPAAPLHAQSCGQVEPDIQIETVFDTPHYDFSYGFSEIQALREKQEGNTNYGSGRMGDRTSRPSDDPLQVMGLTAYQLSLEPHIQMSVRTLAPNRHCVAMSKITLSVGIRNQQVYVARQFPQGTCSYKEILAHERKHVATNKAFIQKLKADMTRALNTAAQDPKVTQAMLVSDPEAARVATEQQLYQSLTGLYKNMVMKLKAMQAQVDSPEEYERIGNGCNGVTNRVLMTYFDAYRQGKAR
ncbi:MAG: hypothetical protein IPI58_04325 [Alphaproteobacteria bacterium]|nr:MAG: hypothetical protein IPI58_04325 [Alphaproteobacteria bacterium]